MYQGMSVTRHSCCKQSATRHSKHSRNGFSVSFVPLPLPPSVFFFLLWSLSFSCLDAPPPNPMQMSEFARTLVYNGQGTDHAWGGNYFLAGGSVRGGQILGNYPTRLDDESDINVRQGGRLLPTTPWEAVWHGLAEWFGVGATEMAGVLPNMANWPAGSMMSEKHLFTG